MTGVRIALQELNSLDRPGFVSVCGPLFERSPWVAERTWPRRPFGSLAELHRELAATVDAASLEEKTELIRSHPDLVGRMAAEQPLGELSSREQAAAGLSSLSPEEAELFRSYNRKYHEKFGFPFVICARENRKEAILQAFPRRLGQSREQEIATALAEIARIAWLRLLDAAREA